MAKQKQTPPNPREKKVFHEILHHERLNRVIDMFVSGKGRPSIKKFLMEEWEMNIENALVISDAAKTVIESETDYTVDELRGLADNCYDFNDLTASINSGSFKASALAIVPCSMKTLSSIANGYGDNTITRVADVSLKERRTTVIVPRETPLRTAHIQNMLTLSQEGAIILPPMPGFYSDHASVNDQINFVVGKILDSLNIENDLFKRWE